VAEIPVNITSTQSRSGEVAPAHDTVYEQAGGQPFFDALAAAFYRRVETDSVLVSLYPEPADLAPAVRRLALFLGQYWGGPTTYSDERGHPRLRMRHAPFSVGPRERDHWMAAMTAALDEVEPSEVLRARFDEYFAMAAEAMRNRDESATS
jgi:hemoglobin